MAGKKREAKAVDKKQTVEKKKEATIKEVTVQKSANGAVVDTNHPQAKMREVASGASGPLSTYLMLSDCGKNNNKFYVC